MRLSARSVAVADVYDALRSKRTCKEPFPHDKSRQILFDGGGTQFDPAVIRAFDATDGQFEQVGIGRSLNAIAAWSGIARESDRGRAPGPGNATATTAPETRDGSPRGRGCRPRAIARPSDHARLSGLSRTTDCGGAAPRRRRGRLLGGSWSADSMDPYGHPPGAAMRGDDHETKILVVVADQGGCRLVQECVCDSAGACFRLVWTDRLCDALEQAAKQPFDAVLFDLDLPDSGGYESFVRIREQVPQTPLIVLTRRADDEMGMRVVAAGGQDYLVSEEVGGGTLVRAIRFAIERQRIRVAHEALCHVDELTGLYNRRGFQVSGDRLLRLSQRRSVGLWLLCADLDGLKGINDRFGHGAGDAALVETANALRATFRSSDAVGRLGGDEFAVLALDAAEGSLELIVERIT